ncbi:hypothetical protein K7B10_39585 [Streptomyces flavotricini]|uniref:DUF2069 domain-containing protein n=1 Tax=Streptomyces flavotricini TaxID=66888 RepID=A0ABS8EHX6_9ACTN|nr:hypothetical protein [Streptomyces flavotricini]MCC0100751.1 hypothetical protein [Streptomyces flavotricini]
MNGNPTYHAIALAAGTLLVLPAPLAILTGWTPRGLRGRQLAARPYAWAVLCLYTLMPLNALPRMLDASAETVMACTVLGFVFIAAAVGCFIQAERTARRAGPKQVA